MKVSVIFRLSDQEESNKKTIENLAEISKSAGNDIQLLVYPGKVSVSQEDLELVCQDIYYCETTGLKAVACYNDARSHVSGDLVTAVDGGDTFSTNAFEELMHSYRKYPEESIFMLTKVMPDEKTGAFAQEIPGQSEVISLWKDYRHYPFYFGGTFLKTEEFRTHFFDEKHGLETERDFFLGLCAEKMQLVFCGGQSYYSSVFREGNFTFFEDIYEEAWYRESFTGYWIPVLAQLKSANEHIPYFIQYHVMFTIANRFTSNWNNRNKHVIPKGEEEHTLELIGQVLRYIDDDIMFNGHRVRECNVTDSVKWVYGILKKGRGFHFDKYYLSGNPYYGSGTVLFNKIANLKTNILFMNYEDRTLHIDGTVHPILFSMADEVYFMFDGVKYPLTYNGRYALNKVFGVSIYKGHSFHVKLPMEQVKRASLFCFARIGGEAIKINLLYDSHFSRMSGAFTNSYWCFGMDPMYMALKEDDGITFSVTTKKEQRKQERRLSLEMLRSFKPHTWLFLAIRKVYFMMRPIMKRKPIWMYIDKIYKAGDSSEYLYRYSCDQKDGIQHYYLVDKHATDYKRLKKDGYHPLVRGSIKHRLVFLMADMMVISNSTVFAFNNYGLPNSSYVRDLVNFHVCCVQHGMSVQKIAVAQNRLRDNTRLYFCASKYEIENLSKPIYDYVGYDALKLTGVPRYDGLVNDDKKQIMISPTWRMQAAVPVRTNEGEQRDYNPLFKESTYFRVFNALINDPRLIEAAKKYGYRIKYVLHPIVSAQVDDFDKNEYVDIIPAVGDMSYERMFCESSLMVTDFSGIQFDFAYMRKPLVYLHHKDIPQHYEEGTFFYDTMAFGEIAHDNDELIDLLCEYMANGCQMKEEYVRRADDFFYYNDHHNCERIYNTMIEYQKEHVLKED